MSYIGSNLKYRQFPGSNPGNTASNIPSSQSLQSSSSKNTTILDSTHSTQNSSQNHSYSNNEEATVTGMSNYTPTQKNNSPVNLCW